MSFQRALGELGNQFDQLQNLRDTDRSKLLMEVTSTVREILNSAKQVDLARSAEVAEATEAARVARRNVADTDALESVERRIAARLYTHGDLREQFLAFDVTKDGRLEADEFRYALSRRGVRLSDAEVDALVHAYDTNGDGKIDYEELVKFVAAAEWNPSYPYGDDATAKASTRGEIPVPTESAESQWARAAISLKARIISKWGGPRDAWLDLHPRRDTSSTMSCKMLSKRLKRYTSLPVSGKILRVLLYGTDEGPRRVDYASFARFVTSAAASDTTVPDELFYNGYGEESDTGSNASSTLRRGRSVKRTAHAVARASAERRSLSAGVATRPATAGPTTKAAEPPARSLRAVLRVIQRGVEGTSHGGKDLHDRMRRHGQLGVDGDDLVWGARRLLRISITLTEANALVKTFDKDQDGQLSFGEFLGLLHDAAEA